MGNHDNHIHCDMMRNRQIKFGNQSLVTFLSVNVHVS